MIKRAELKRVLENAILAPSMLNMQPWGFRVRDNVLEVWIDIARATLFCDPNRTNLYLSAGAVIENISLTARALGYRVTQRFFPQRYNPDLVAEVSFEATDEPPDADELYRFIPVRRTNRKRFSPRIVLDEQKVALRSCIPADSKLSLLFEKNPALQRALLIADRVRFSNAKLVGEFTEVLKSKSRRIGLRSQNLELDWGRALVFNAVAKTWIFLNLFGAPFLVPFYYTRRHLVDTSTIGWLVGTRSSPLQIVEAGRAMQRILLKATSLGIHSHIINFPLMYLESKDIALDPREGRDVETMRDILKEQLASDGSSVLAIFRLGYSKRSNARTTRQPLESFLIPERPF